MLADHTLSVVGKFSFQRVPALLVALSACALLAALFASATPAAAQTSSDTSITGGEGVVTVVSAPGGTVTRGTGSGPAGSPGVWPYTCNFYVGVTLDDLAIGVNPKPGYTYHLVCNPRAGFEDRARIDNIAYVYNPAGPIDPLQPDLVTSAQLQDIATEILNPTDLPPAYSPDDRQITGVETWLWPEGDTTSTSVFASAGGLTVTIESRYRETEFVMSGANEGSVACQGAPEWSPGSTASPCTFTFFEEGAQTITATTTWDLWWWDNALSPAPQPLGTITETFVDGVEVMDLEAVITRN